MFQSTTHVVFYAPAGPTVDQTNRTMAQNGQFSHLLQQPWCEQTWEGGYSLDQFFTGNKNMPSSQKCFLGGYTPNQGYGTVAPVGAPAGMQASVTSPARVRIYCKYFFRQVLATCVLYVYTNKFSDKRFNQSNLRHHLILWLRGFLLYDEALTHRHTHGRTLVK